MLVSFSVANFRSFNTEVTFSLVASKSADKTHADHARPIPHSDAQVLKAAVVYGANGAGKSNLFRALIFLKSIAINNRSRESRTGRESFKFGGLPTQPSQFDLQFIAGGKLYRFGFSLDDEAILEEWLVEAIGEEEHCIYERTVNERGVVEISAPGFAEYAKLSALAVVGGPRNQSFLATLNTIMSADDLNSDLRNVIEWFNHSLKLIGPSDDLVPIGGVLSNDADFLTFASDFLKDSATGVDRLQTAKIEITEQELSSMFPASLVSRITGGLPKDSSGIIVQLDEGQELHVERDSKNRYYRISVQAAHRHETGNTVWLDLAEESDGTRRLLNLIPALYQLRATGAVFFIDEIDRSLHPILIIEFFKFFLRDCSGEQRQIIVTTHESNLLDLEILRRDEIWFAEKDPGGATHLYSLTDFKIRSDSDLRRHYLQGRFGAVPFLGGWEKLSTSFSETP